MKWKDYTLIGLLILVLFLVYRLRLQNQSSSQKINQLSLQVDSLQGQTTLSVIQYKDRVKTNTKIVDRWNNTYTVDSFTSIDTLFLQAKNDINYLDTSIRECDTALSNCLSLSKFKSELISEYKNKKEPIIVPYLGVGLSYSETFRPSIQLGLGINLRKLNRK
jgi:hypothetical protein